MSLLITRRPEKRFNGTVKFSRWGAINNPYIFEFTRTDVSVTSTGKRSAYSTTQPTSRVNLDPLLVAFLFEVGEEIYINCGSYNGIFTVTAISGQYVTFDSPLLGSYSGGRINLLEKFINYRPSISIYDGQSGDLIDTLYPRTDSTGFLICDISGVVRSTIETAFEANQTDINVANTRISGSLNVGYSATYTLVGDGVNTEVTLPEITDEYIYYWSSSSRQIDGNVSDGMDGIGQNLKEYVPKNIVGNESLFLTMFETPTYFEGFPFTLSFLYDEHDFENNYLVRHQQDLNVNGVDVGSESEDNIFISGKGYLNHMKVRTPNSGAPQFDAWLEIGDTIPTGIFISGSVFTYVGISYFTVANPSTTG